MNRQYKRTKLFIEDYNYVTKMNKLWITKKDISGYIYAYLDIPIDLVNTKVNDSNNYDKILLHRNAFWKSFKAYNIRKHLNLDDLSNCSIRISMQFIRSDIYYDFLKTQFDQIFSNNIDFVKKENDDYLMYERSIKKDRCILLNDDISIVDYTELNLYRIEHSNFFHNITKVYNNEIFLKFLKIKKNKKYYLITTRFDKRSSFTSSFDFTKIERLTRKEGSDLKVEALKNIDLHQMLKL